MIKYLTILFFLLVGFSANAQFPYKQTLGNPSTLVYSKGGLGADSTLVFNNAFADTTAANLGYIKNIAGAIIRTSDNKLWLRNNVATAWVQVGTGSGGSNIFAESVVSSNDSVFLRNEKIYPIRTNTFYGDSSGVAGFHNTIVVNQFGVANTFMLKWDESASEYVVFNPDTLISSIQFPTPVNNDSTWSMVALKGRDVLLLSKNGSVQTESNTAGYSRQDDSTLVIHPPPTTGQNWTLITISRMIHSVFDTTGIGINPTPPAAWDSLFFQTQEGLSRSAGIETPTTNNLNTSRGLDDISLAASQSGRIAFQFLGGGVSREGELAFSTTNTLTVYTDIKAGMQILTDGSVYVGDGGGATYSSIGYSVSPGDWVAIFRENDGMTFDLQTSSDKVTWTTRYTFTYQGSSAMYVHTFMSTNFTYKIAYAQIIKY